MTPPTESAAALLERLSKKMDEACPYGCRAEAGQRNQPVYSNVTGQIDHWRICCWPGHALKSRLLAAVEAVTLERVRGGKATCPTCKSGNPIIGYSADPRTGCPDRFHHDLS